MQICHAHNRSERERERALWPRARSRCREVEGISFGKGVDWAEMGVATAADPPSQAARRKRGARYKQTGSRTLASSSSSKEPAR